MSFQRKRCVYCRLMTENWTYYSGPSSSTPVFCQDGCYSTTGRDRRTKDGEPASKPSSTGLAAWAPERMVDDYVNPFG